MWGHLSSFTSYLIDVSISTLQNLGFDVYTRASGRGFGLYTFQILSVFGCLHILPNTQHWLPTRISPLQECLFKSQNQSPQESYSAEKFVSVFKYQWNRKPHEIFFNDGFSAEILSVFFKANRIFTVVDDVFQFSGIALLLKPVSGWLVAVSCSFCVCLA